MCFDDSLVYTQFENAFSFYKSTIKSFYCSFPSLTNEDFSSCKKIQSNHSLQGDKTQRYIEAKLSSDLMSSSSSLLIRLESFGRELQQKR